MLSCSQVYFKCNLFVHVIQQWILITLKGISILPLLLFNSFLFIHCQSWAVFSGCSMLQGKDSTIFSLEQGLGEKEVPLRGRDLWQNHSQGGCHLLWFVEGDERKMERKEEHRGTINNRTKLKLYKQERRQKLITYKHMGLKGRGVKSSQCIMGSPSTPWAYSSITKGWFRLIHP